MKQRDTNIDNSRAMIMLYIVLVIHGIHYFHYIPTRSTLFSLMLFEMPIVFFISGVSCMLSSRKTILQTITSRIKRVIIPYYIWAFFALAAIVATHSFTWDGFRLMLSCHNIINIPCVTQMWFVLPYVLVFVLGSILLKVYDYCKEHKLQKVFFCSSLIIISLSIAILDYLKATWSIELLRDILVYGLFFLIGFAYKISNKWASFFIMIGLVGWMTLIQFGGYPFATQDNKFPPNLCFIFWGLAAIGVLSLFLNNIKLPSNRIFDIWNKYGLEIYLYQNFAYWPLLKIVSPHLSCFHIFVQYLITTLLAFTILTICAKPINKMNSIVIDFICNTLSPKSILKTK